VGRKKEFCFSFFSTHSASFAAVAVAVAAAAADAANRLDLDLACPVCRPTPHLTTGVAVF